MFFFQFKSQDVVYTKNWNSDGNIILLLLWMEANDFVLQFYVINVIQNKEMLE